MDSGAATPVASRANGVTDGDRTRLRRVTACPRRQTSTVTTSGSSWNRTTFSRASTERYDLTSSRGVCFVIRTGIEPVKVDLKIRPPHQEKADR